MAEATSGIMPQIPPPDEPPERLFVTGLAPSG